MPARNAPVYSFAGAERGMNITPVKNPGKISLRTQASRGSADTVGYTTYDQQSNCTMGWQIEHRNTGVVHMDWMFQDNGILGSGRNIHYQAFTERDCSQAFADSGIIVETSYSGYCNLDVAEDAWGIPTAHTNIDGNYYAMAYWDLYIAPPPPFGAFAPDAPYDRFGWYLNNGTGPGNENIWPKIAYQWNAPGDPVLHLVTAESGGLSEDPQTISYYRRVGPYGAGLGIWSSQRLIDTVKNINVTVVCSRVTGKVAIVWNAPVDYKRDTPDEFLSQLENDVWYAVANDFGATWASASPGPSIGHQVDIGAYAGANITQYTPESEWKAYCDMAAAITSTDELHILWGCRQWMDGGATVARRNSAIFHWADLTPLVTRTVVRATYDDGGDGYAHSWGSDVAKMSISECDGKMYCLYTQFGRSDNPSGDADYNTRILNGYLYMSAYDPALDFWDRGQRVTNTPETPYGCTPGDMSGPGDCNSEYWATMARSGRYDSCWADPEDWVLDILYINDYAPGACVHSASGVWTVNHVIWARYPCREATPTPDYTDNAGDGYGICYDHPELVVPPDHDTSWSLEMENYGTALCSINVITVTQNDPNVLITVVPGAPPVITIPPFGGMVSTTINISAGLGATDPSTVVDTITITHNALFGPRIIPVCVTVSSTYVPLDSAILATTCQSNRILNDGGLRESMGFLDETGCAEKYLYDGSPIVCREVEGQKRCYLSVFSHTYRDERALRQVTPVTVNTDSADYIKASAEFITGDTAIRLAAEYYVPTAPVDCGYIIQKLLYWNITGSVLPGVAVGEIVDWDVPSYESEFDNESGFDADRRLIYQYACGMDPCATTEAVNRYAGLAAYQHQPFKNYFTLENDVWVHSSGPYGEEAPFPDEETYALMTGFDGFNPAVIPACEDLTTLVTFGVYDMEPEDTICVIKILTTSRYDINGSYMKDNVDLANTFIDDHPEIKCFSSCDCRPGDANADSSVIVADAVYLISWIFKGGPPPVPYPICSGDANCDCTGNVGDAVYLINYVFLGGPPPCTCDEWLANCGPPLRK